MKRAGAIRDLLPYAIVARFEAITAFANRALAVLSESASTPQLCEFTIRARAQVLRDTAEMMDRMADSAGFSRWANHKKLRLEEYAVHFGVKLELSAQFAKVDQKVTGKPGRGSIQFIPGYTELVAYNLRALDGRNKVVAEVTGQNYEAMRAELVEKLIETRKHVKRDIDRELLPGEEEQERKIHPDDDDEGEE